MQNTKTKKFINEIKLPEDPKEILSLYQACITSKDPLLVNGAIKAFTDNKDPKYRSVILALQTHADTMPKPILYAIATEYQVIINGLIQWEAEIVYTHAMNPANAKIIFLSNPLHKKHRIVAIGPVVGYFVQDKHGEVLSV